MLSKSVNFISLPCESSTYERFKAKVQNQKLTVRGTLQIFIRKVADGEIDLENQTQVHFSTPKSQ